MAFTGVITAPYYDLFAQALSNASALPVELNAFDGRSEGSAVVLEWTTASETDGYGFEVERAAARAPKEGRFTIVGFAQGAGTSSAPLKGGPPMNFEPDTVTMQPAAR